MNCGLAKEWINCADEDYIASRILYFHDKPDQMATLACQAIEKYMKGFLLLHSLNWNKKGVKVLYHDFKKILKACKEIEKDFLSAQFVEKLFKLEKLYWIRYPSDPKRPDEIEIGATLLEDVDALVAVLRNKIVFPVRLQQATFINKVLRLGGQSNDRCDPWSLDYKWLTLQNKCYSRSRTFGTVEPKEKSKK